MNSLRILSIIIIIFSCKTTTEPVVYDKNQDLIDKEIQIIHQLIYNENWIEAEKLLDRNISLYPDNADLKVMNAFYLLQMEKLDQSYEIFAKLEQAKIRNPMVYTGLARISRLKGEPDKANEWIQKGLYLSQTQSSLWFEKGLIEYTKKDYKQALVLFNKASSLDINNPDYLFFKYAAYLQTGRELDEVKHHWDSLLKKQRMKPYYYLYHADALYQRGLIEFCEAIIDDGLKQFPLDSYLLNFKSYLTFEIYQKKTDPALLAASESLILKCIENTKNMEPGFLDTWFLILEAQKKNSQISIELNKYILQFPDSEILIKWIKKYETNR